MIRLILLAAAAALLASCDTLREWAASQPPPSGDPSVPPPHGQLPQFGGGDLLDVVVTVLSLFGLMPAARIVSSARPLIAAAIRALIPQRPPTPPAPPATPEL